MSRHTGYNARKEAAPRPLKVQRILARYGIRQRALAGVMIQPTGRSAGRPISPTALTHLLTRGLWPAESDRARLQAQAEAYLMEQGVPAEDLADCWEVDEHPHWVPIHPAEESKAGARANGAGPDEKDPLPETEMLSQAARSHFRLASDPFLDDVQGPDDLFLSSEQQYIRAAMWQAANHGGFLAVVGESGAGKTVLRKDLLDRIRREAQPIRAIQPRMIDKGKLHASAISDAIICDCSLEAPRRSIEAKDRQVERVLTSSSRAGVRHVLLIEEAHDLTVSTLKKLKRYWELEDGFRRLLAIILIGQPELRDKLDERVNWDAREVIRRCEIAELHPLAGDLEHYVGLKLRRVGADPAALLDPSAYDALRRRLTVRARNTAQAVDMTYPLVVNNALKRALNAAAEIGEPRVTREIVEGI